MLFAPWAFVVAVNSAPKEVRERVQKSAFIQQGNKMPIMRKEPPKVKGQRLIPEVTAVTQTFKKEYAKKDLEILWGALLKCYGTKELALQAVRTNPQIVNPSYSFCNVMLESKQALLGIMSSEEALEVMMLNPAVLQCGPSLASLGSAEIKAFANLRSIGNRIPEESRLLSLTTLFAVISFPVLAAQVPALADSGVLSTSESVVGALGAPIFAAAILIFLKGGGSGS